MTALIILILSGFSWTTQCRGEGDVLHMRVDALSQIYTLNEEELKKYSPSGQELFSASFNAAGTPTHLDVSNPMKPFLFYKGTGNLLLLDNTLSPQHQIFDLYAETQRTVEAVCGSFNNHFWLYDSELTEIVRVDMQFRQTDSSGPLFSLLPKLNAVNEMREQGNHLYVLQEGDGIYVFDQFANYLYKLAIPSAKHFGFWGNDLVYTDGSQLLIHRRFQPEDEQVELSIQSTTVHSPDGFRCLLSGEGKWIVMKAEPVD